MALAVPSPGLPLAVDNEIDDESRPWSAAASSWSRRRATTVYVGFLPPATLRYR